MKTFNIILLIIGLITLGLIIFLEINRRKNQKEQNSWLDIRNETSGDPLDNYEDYATVDNDAGIDQHYYEPEPLEDVGDEPINDYQIDHDELVEDEIGEVRVVSKSKEPEIEPIEEPEPELANIDEGTAQKTNAKTQAEFDFDNLEQTPVDEATTNVVTESEPVPSARVIADDDEFKSQYEEIYALTVMAKEDDMFEGADIMREFNALNLQAGDDGLYHRPLPGRQDITLFSIANLMQPGKFEPGKMLELKTRGLLLFMHLPSKLEPVQAFDQFYDAADALAVTLGGQICDENRNSLSQHRLEQMRDKIHHLALKLQLERKKAGKT